MSFIIYFWIILHVRPSQTSWLRSIRLVKEVMTFLRTESMRVRCLLWRQREEGVLKFIPPYIELAEETTARLVSRKIETISQQAHTLAKLEKQGVHFLVLRSITSAVNNGTLMWFIIWISEWCKLRSLLNLLVRLHLPDVSSELSLDHQAKKP